MIHEEEENADMIDTRATTLSVSTLRRTSDA
jgi:hypothetical protein